MRGSLPAVAANWTVGVNRHEVLVPRAGDYYGGRAFQEAVHVSRHLSARLGIVSAGLGFVWSDAVIPAYDLTISAGDNSIRPYLRANGLNTADWWRELNEARGRARPLKHLLDVQPNAMMLVALPSTYLEMVGEELEALPQPGLRRVRLFTSPSGTALLAERVRAQVLPYDDRLEGTPYAGTKSDFPQRAMRHFVEALEGHGLSITSAVRNVVQSMDALPARTHPQRQRQTDDEIVMTLKAQWERHGGAGGRLLRHLRDEAGVACEQSRFKELWHRVRAELSEAQS
ncbi:hypothetical protein ACWA7J_01975 [Leptothrix sp. BB-4]